MDIRTAISEERARNLLQTIMENDEAPSPNDAAPLWPSAKRHTIDRERDAELANVLSKTEIMIADFHESGHLTLRSGQKLVDMLRHPEFDIKDMRSDTIIHLLRRLERPFKESAVQIYNLWKEGDGNQRLELVVRDFRDTFIEIMRNPQWASHFDLTFRPIFDVTGRRVIGPACSALWWEHMQKKRGASNAIGAAQLYFDATFQGQNQGIETGSLASMNLRQDARFQTRSIQMFCLMPIYDVDAAAAAGLNEDQIKQRKMEVHQASIAAFVRDMNQYSSVESQVMVPCPDQKVYPMPILVACLAMDHEGTEKHCLKAANGCLSCDCPPNEFADCSGRSRTPMLVEDVIRKVKEAAADLLNSDGTIKVGCIGRVQDWEKEHKIKLQWNNWWDVSFAHFFLLLSLTQLFYALPLV
jgi:hypothetical protein